MRIDIKNNTDISLYNYLPFVKIKVKKQYIEDSLKNDLRDFDEEISKIFKYENNFKTFIEATNKFECKLEEFIKNHGNNY